MSCKSLGNLHTRDKTSCFSGVSKNPGHRHITEKHVERASPRSVEKPDQHVLQWDKTVFENQRHERGKILLNRIGNAKAHFALVGLVNGCFRGANESVSENVLNSKTLPSGEDHGVRRECTLDASTLNEVPGSAAPVTPHTHLLGDPCLAHVLPFEMSSVQSSSAAERAKVAMVGPANGCSRGATESMSEILVTSNTPPFGEDTAITENARLTP